jgi:hypothetical protein
MAQARLLGVPGDGPLMQLASLHIRSAHALALLDQPDKAVEAEVSPLSPLRLTTPSNGPIRMPSGQTRLFELSRD